MKNTITTRIAQIFGNLNRARSAKVPLLIITLVAIIGLSIAGCSKGGGGSGGGGGKIPNGTYETADGYTSFTFKGNQITIIREGKVMTESAYEIQDGKIWYTGYGGEKDDLDYKLDGNVLTIGVSKYTKK